MPPKYVSTPNPTRLFWQKIETTYLASGTGQTSRVDALNQANNTRQQALVLTLEESAMASDAFFPFPDCVEIADKAGIKSSHSTRRLNQR